ncbi:MAG: hypothetical protein ACLTYN_15125 [Dysosmobacter welbionis]
MGVLPRTHAPASSPRPDPGAFVCTWTPPPTEAGHHLGGDGEAVYTTTTSPATPWAGQTCPFPGRREIGHGALAGRLCARAPSVEEFPYAIRVVSEVLSSNGSTSRAPSAAHPGPDGRRRAIKAPVAGISCGLIRMTTAPSPPSSTSGRGGLPRRDGLQGGRHQKGITAIQMDLKTTA